MRYSSFALTAVAMIFLSTSAMAQNADIQWKDLSAPERQSILNTWRAQPQEGKESFIIYREKAIKNLSDEKKARYAEEAKERAEREVKLQKEYEKRVAAEAKTDEAKKATGTVSKPTITPTATEIAPIEPIAEKETGNMKTAEPATAAEPAKPAVATQTPSAKDMPQKEIPEKGATEKAKEMLKKFF